MNANLEALAKILTPMTDDRARVLLARESAATGPVPQGFIPAELDLLSAEDMVRFGLEAAVR